MTRLTDRGAYALIALATGTALAIATGLIPTVGPVLAVIGKWLVLYVAPAVGAMWLAWRCGR